MPGVRLGAYEVLRLIGAGGMGEVYEARDTRLDRIVAVKVLPYEFASAGTCTTIDVPGRDFDDRCGDQPSDGNLRAIHARTRTCVEDWRSNVWYDNSLRNVD
jgi:serine/threonine protein kinase